VLRFGDIIDTNSLMIASAVPPLARGDRGQRW